MREVGARLLEVFFSIFLEKFLRFFEVEVGFFFLSFSLLSRLLSSLTLSAAIAEKNGAPVYSRQPPMTATRPAWPLRREPAFFLERR